MSEVGVSVLNGLGVSIYSARFPSRKGAKYFIEWRIEELLTQGAIEIVMVDFAAQAETRYSASAIADGVFATLTTDWRYALAQKTVTINHRLLSLAALRTAIVGTA